MALQKLFAVILTTLVGLAAFSNGQLYEYPALRIVSPSAAVVTGVSSANACKSYLVAHQNTLDAVSFDSRNKNCTSVAKYVNYWMQYAVDWTTFKIAQAPQDASTSYPATSNNTQAHSTRTNNSTQTYNATQGYHNATQGYHNATQGYYNATQGYHNATQGYHNATQGYHNATQGYHNATQGYYTTTQSNYNVTHGYNSSRVIGICEGYGDLHLEPEQEISFSVYSANYDFCSSFPDGANFYQTNMQCTYRINSHDVEGFEYKLSYDLHYGDSLVLNDDDEWYRYTGLNSQVQNSLRGQNARIEFNSDSAWVAKGFCLTIKAKTRLNSATERPHSNATGSTSKPDQTYGVCHSSKYVTIGETGLFTFEPYSSSACSSFPSSSYYYTSSSDCAVQVDSFYDTVGYQYTISYETEECCDYIGLSNNTDGNGEIEFRGSSVRSGYLEGRNARISFYSDFVTEGRGFCLQLTPVRQPSYTTLPASNATQVANHTKTVGVCGGYNDPRVEFGQVVTFAVYSYEYDLCPGFPSQAITYQNNRYCSQAVENPEADGFEFSVDFDLANGDKLEISSSETRLSYTNRNDSVYQYIRGRYVSITFQSDSKDVGKGFCLKITPRKTPVTVSAPAIVSTTTQPRSSQTIGVCDYHFQDYAFALNQSVSLSSDSRDYNCENQQVYAFFSPNTMCTMKFEHPTNSIGRWTLQLLTPSNAPYTKLSANVQSEFTNTIDLVASTIYYVSARTLEIVWTTEPYLQKGVYTAFCLKFEAY